MILIDKITNGGLIVCKTGFKFADFLNFTYTIKDEKIPSLHLDVMLETPAKDSYIDEKLRQICTKRDGRYPKHRVVISDKDKSFEIVCFIILVFNKEIQRMKISEIKLNQPHELFGKTYQGEITPLTLFNLSGKYHDERRKKSGV